MPTGMAEDNFIFFMHPDHLGSTSFVTDRDGGLYEHVAYFPFGETWVEQASDTEDIPYLFTGKELDQETGLYYFGARYYDPRTSVWESADPAHGNHFEPKALSLFSYTFQNPVRLTDPTGKWPDGQPPTGKARADEQGAGMRILKGGINSIIESISEVAQGAALLDAPIMLDAQYKVDALQQAQAATQEIKFDGVSVVDELIGGAYVAVAGTILSELAETPLGRVLRGAEAAADPVVTTGAPTESDLLKTADALAWEQQAAEAAKTGGGRKRAAVTIGRYDPATQEAGGFSSRFGRHAEGVAKDAMPNGKFSKPIHVKSGTYKNVCPPCEAEHGRAAFPDDTTFDSDYQ